MNIKPLFDRVVLKPEPINKPTQNLIIPDNKLDMPTQAKVIAVGAGTKEKPIIVNLGDIVLFNAYAGNEFIYEKESYFVVCQDDILAILEDKECQK